MLAIISPAKTLDYKRPLLLGQAFTVRTWVDDIARDTVRVHFEIVRRPTRKLCADGYCAYTMVNLATGRGEPIPGWIAEKYAI